MSESDLAEIVAVRQLLEPPAMRRLAASLDQRRVPALRALAERIVTGARNGDLRAYLAADQDFHLSLLESLGNHRLVNIVRDLRSETRLVGLVNLVASEELLVSAREHHELVDLLADGDGAGAERLMVHHVQHILGWWAGCPESSS